MNNNIPNNINNDNNDCCNCIYDILRKIVMLQKQDYDNDNYVGCDKPYLGPVTNSVCYNTRPIILYNCCSGNPWTFNITSNVQNTDDGQSTDNSQNTTSYILRVENCDDCCCTCRILYQTSENTYESTNNFVTISLNCVGAIRCLTDTYVDLCS